MRKLLVLFGVFMASAYMGAISLVAQDAEAQVTGFQTLKQYFIEGNWKFMSLVLICLILGLATRIFSAQLTVIMLV